MKEKICIDIRPAQTGAKNTGTGVYARELVKAQQQISHNLDVWYLVLSNYPLPDLHLPLDRLVRVSRPRKPERWHAMYDDIFMLSKQLDHEGFNLVHSLTPGAIYPSGNMRVVATVLDLIPILFPEDYIRGDLDVRWLYQRKLKIISRANHLIAISDATRRDIVKLLQVQPDKVSVVHLASKLDLFPASQESVSALKKRTDLPDRYILYLGGYSSRKNVLLLIHAFYKLKELRRDVKLVLAGSIDRRADDALRGLLAEMEIENDVILAGHFADEDLPALYSGAMLFVYPSLYEGFGLPIIEAMACGTPVITSRLGGSLSEVAGGAALLIDPYNQDELSDTILKVCGNITLQEELRQLGLSRSRTFTWHQCARETLSVYQKILS